jgi:hypothetical protein
MKSEIFVWHQYSNTLYVWHLVRKWILSTEQLPRPAKLMPTFVEMDVGSAQPIPTSFNLGFPGPSRYFSFQAAP